MKHLISFFVEGDPQGQPRHRGRILKTRKAGILDAKLHTYATTTKFFMRVVREARRHAPAAPLTGPVSVDLFFKFAKPASVPFMKVWMDKKPDRDNLDKGVLDALTRCKFWLDDCQVCDGAPKKQYAQPGQKTGVYISVWQLEESVGSEE